MAVIQRSGWYLSTRPIPIPVGNKVIYYLQKIHSSHEDFGKIHSKYFSISLKHEASVPPGERNRYIPFDGAVPSYQKKGEDFEVKKPKELEILDSIEVPLPEKEKIEIPVISKEAPKESIIEELVSEGDAIIAAEEPKEEKKPKKKKQPKKEEIQPEEPITE